MDKLGAHQRSLKLQAKAKKKPVKVVYISNPTRVKATVSQFKALVQELTGKYSDIADLSKFTDLDHAGEAAADQVSSSTTTTTDDCLVTASRPGLGNEELQQQQQQQQQRGGPPRMGTPFDKLGEVFTPDMLENLGSFMPASPYYEPYPPVDSIRGFDFD